jgi:hypothetical protein
MKAPLLAVTKPRIEFPIDPSPWGDEKEKIGIFGAGRRDKSSNVRITYIYNIYI